MNFILESHNKGYDGIYLQRKISIEIYYRMNYLDLLPDDLIEIINKN